MGAMTDLLDAFVGELRHAVRDTRQKLVEEGWFGRATTAEPVIQQEPGRDIWGREPSFEDRWAPREAGQEPGREAPEHGHDFDR